MNIVSDSQLNVVKSNEISNNGVPENNNELLKEKLLEELDSWESAALGENRSVVAMRIRHAVETGLAELDLNDFTSLTSLPENLPQGLTHIFLNGCTSLTSLPEKLPQGLTHIFLNGCTSLTSLPENLPWNLTKLDLSGCTSLVSLPKNMPQGLITLDISHCTALNHLPELPNRLTSLNLTGWKLFTERLSLMGLAQSLFDGREEINLLERYLKISTSLKTDKIVFTLEEQNALQGMIKIPQNNDNRLSFLVNLQKCHKEVREVVMLFDLDWTNRLFNFIDFELQDAKEKESFSNLQYEYLSAPIFSGFLPTLIEGALIEKKKRRGLHG